MEPPHERLRGKKATMMSIELGEAIHARGKPPSGPISKLASLWEDGIFLGVRASSGESVVGTRTGVVKVRNVMRKPGEERWKEINHALVTGVPWQTPDKEENRDGMVEPFMVPPMERVPELQYSEEMMPRRMAIKKEDLEQAGYTPKCPGC